MEPGDIIVYKVNNKTSNIISRLISWISRVTVGNWLVNDEDSFNHVAIYAGNGMQYEMTWPSGTKSKIKSDNYDMYCASYPNLGVFQRDKILNYCKANLSVEYDWLSLLTFGLLKFRDKTLCSEFVADAYLQAGIALRKKDESLISPNEIAYNKLLVLEKI